MDGKDGRRQEWNHLSGAPGESWPLTVVMDGNSALPSVGLAGCLAQPYTPGWGIPCGAGLLFLWLGDQLSAPQGKGWQKELCHAPRALEEKELHMALQGNLRASPDLWLFSYSAARASVKPRGSQHNFTARSLGIWHTCALCKQSRLSLSVIPRQLLEMLSRSLGSLSGGWEVGNVTSSPADSPLSMQVHP